MNEIKIGAPLWHPCSVGIIEHKVIGVHQYEGFTQYTARAVHNVGACGRVEVVLDFRKGKLRFVELVHEETLPHASGLQDFVEGEYYTNHDEARLVLYRQQLDLSRRAVERAEAHLKSEKAQYDKVVLIVTTIMQQLKEKEDEQRKTD
jgi:hypothetical protein